MSPNGGRCYSVRTSFASDTLLERMDTGDAVRVG
jgi:hypothetical protein